MTTAQSVITVMVVVVGTMMTRFLPFIIFPGNKELPKTVEYLGVVLPYAIIGLLVVYSLKDAVFSEYRALPELISVAAVVFIHKLRKNTLLSIGVGTALYMVLVQNVF